MMSLNEYQTAARSTAIYPDKEKFGGIVYCALKLNGEAGEVAEKVGKVMRDEASKLSDARRNELIKELGDVLWYVANLAHELSASLEQIAARNVEKLADRKARNMLHGAGDNR